MNCWICDGAMSPCFTKDFQGEWGLGEAVYVKCEFCGLVVSETLYDMPDPVWAELNRSLHTALFSFDYLAKERRAGLARQRRQAANIFDLFRKGALSADLPWLDYGCGTGYLADLLLEYGLPTLKYDPYMQGEGFEAEVSGPHSLVLSTAVMEHIRGRESFDEMAGLVGPGGALGFQTYAFKIALSNPEHIALLPSHCTFLSEQALDILFAQWAFDRSAHFPIMTFWWRSL